jgi:CHAT domain-containing protein
MDHSSNRPGQRDDRELADRLCQVRLDLEQLVASIRAATAADTRPQLDLAEILALAPEGGALVAPVLTPQGSVAFVIPHGVQRVGSEHIVWLEAFTLEDWLRLLRGSFEEGQLGGWLEAYVYRRNKPANWRAALEITGRELWEKLIGLVHERLAELGLGGGAPVLLLPQSGLGLLPLHAAWREVDTSRRAFLDDYAVSYSPSVYALSVCRRHTALRQGPQQPSLLIGSNPTADLPLAALETDVVMALFEPASGRMLTAAKATPAAVSSRASGHRYIHFACHGIYDWDNVIRSRLQLAGENQLTLPDIITGLDLRGVRLVTLSACETSVFKIVGTPDEYVGLPSAFLQAGAPAVVGSLWAVNDLSTALLMKEFYRRHLAGGQPIAVALRGAQLWLRDTTAQEVALADIWQQIYRTSGQRDAQAFRAMRYYRSHPDERPFAHPEYWAAFTASRAT